MTIEQLQSATSSGFSTVSSGVDRQQDTTEAAIFSSVWELVQENQNSDNLTRNETDGGGGSFLFGLEDLFSMLLPGLLGVTDSEFGSDAAGTEADSVTDSSSTGNQSDAPGDTVIADAPGDNSGSDAPGGGSGSDAPGDGDGSNADAPGVAFTGTGPVGSVGTGISQITPQGTIAAATLMQSRDEAYAAYVNGGEVDPGWWFVFSRNAEDERIGMNWDPNLAPAKEVSFDGTQMVVDARFDKPFQDPYSGKLNYFSYNQPLPADAYVGGSEAQQSANAYWGTA